MKDSFELFGERMEMKLASLERALIAKINEQTRTLIRRVLILNVTTGFAVFVLVYGAARSA